MRSRSRFRKTPGLTRPHGWQQQPPSASILPCIQDAILAEFVFHCAREEIKKKKTADHTMGDAERTIPSSSRETADELVPGEDFWWDSDVRQRRRHHQPGVSLADRPLGSQLLHLSLSEWVLPSSPFPSTRELLSRRLRTRPLPLSALFLLLFLALILSPVLFRALACPPEIFPSRSVALSRQD